MTDELKRLRDEAAEKRSLRQCTTAQPDLDKAVSWYLKIGFQDGADWMAQHVHLIKEIQNLHIALKEFFEEEWACPACSMSDADECVPCDCETIDQIRFDKNLKLLNTFAAFDSAFGGEK